MEIGTPGFVDADDVTPRVDANGLGSCRARRVDGGEGFLVEQKAVADVGAPDLVVADDVTPRVDTDGKGPCGAGDVEGGERVGGNGNHN